MDSVHTISEKFEEEGSDDDEVEEEAGINEVSSCSLAS
jgi:hypothetical protein